MKISSEGIDITKVPFSRFGSYFVISYMDRRLVVRDIRNGDTSLGILYDIDLPTRSEVIMTPEELLVETPDGKVTISFLNEDTLHFKGNLALKLKGVLKRYDSFCQIESDAYELTSYSGEIKVAFKSFKGDYIIDAPWDEVGTRDLTISYENIYEFVLCSYQTVFKTSLISHRPQGYDYKLWQHMLPDDHTDATYITWMNFVKPEGILKRNAMYMSKNWMTNIWSWDNCFSAIFLSHIDPDLALDQYLMFSDYQDRSGMYPDFVNNQYVSYSCTKPPIYGWAYQMMTKVNPIFNNITLQEKVYNTIKQLTCFWMNYRTSENGLPYYVHGNESGWDNGTFYREGVPLNAPDLAAYLIRQMDFLSSLSKDLGLKKESLEWRRKADDLFALMMEHLFDDEFYAINPFTGHQVKSHYTLQRLLPLVIHYRLSKEVKKEMVDSLENDFLTDYGLATESTESPYYRKNGYWRGPIWAPIMMIFVDVLDEMDHPLHHVVMRRFYDCMSKNGMAENYDPLTGEGLKDPAFAWTSSTYLHFKIKYKL